MNIDRVECRHENEEADGTINVSHIHVMLTAMHETIEEQYCNQFGYYVLLYHKVICCCALAEEYSQLCAFCPGSPKFLYSI